MLSVTVDKNNFCPYDIIKINFNKISIPYIRSVTENDIYVTAPYLIKNSMIRKNYFIRRDKVVCVSLIKKKMDDQKINPFYVYYYVKELMKKYKCIPISKGSNIDEIVIINKDNDVSNCYSNTIKDLYHDSPENIFTSCDFNLESYLSSGDRYMSFHIADKNKYIYLLEIPGIIDVSFCDIKKVSTYYGIEVAREMTKKRFLELTPRSKFLDIILDFLTYKGIFTTGETNSIIRSIAGNEMKKDIKRYTTTFEEDSYEDDLETRMLLGRINSLSLEGVIDK
jgi:hypothetical protein